MTGDDNREIRIRCTSVINIAGLLGKTLCVGTFVFLRYSYSFVGSAKEPKRETKFFVIAILGARTPHDGAVTPKAICRRTASRGGTVHE